VDAWPSAFVRAQWDAMATDDQKQQAMNEANKARMREQVRKEWAEYGK